jgi:hypothetical protein
MKKQTHDMMRQAYIDNQLSVEEAIRFEGELSPSEQRELQNETQFQKTLARHLAAGDDCPDEVWQKIRRQLRNEDNAVPPVRQLSPWSKLLAAAATIAIVATIALQFTRNQPHEVAQLPAFVPSEEIDTVVEVPGDYRKVGSALAANGFIVNLREPSKGQHHPIDLLGGRFLHVGDKTVAQIFFSCCQQPVQVLVEINSAQLVLDNWNSDDLSDTWYAAHRVIDRKYRVLAVSPHQPDQVLDLFS